MSVKSQFLGLLRKNGISEYWCSEDFDPNEKHPKGRLLIETESIRVMDELAQLYYQDIDDYLPDIVYIAFLNHSEVRENTASFRGAIKELQRIRVL